MNAEEKLQMLMKKGYNLHIECKSIHRIYALSYEVTARRATSLTAAHATGNTLNELVDNLIEQIKQYDSEKLESI